MSGWGIATVVAIWTLLIGSVAVFVWFLSEVVRVARRGHRDQARSTRSSSRDRM